MTHRLPKRRPPKRHYIWLLIHTLGLMLLGLWVIPALISATMTSWSSDLDSPIPAHVSDHFAYMERHLEAPFAGYQRYQVGSDEQGIVALSHMATGLMNLVSAQPALKARYKPSSRALVERALHPKHSPYQAPLEQVKELGDHNLYLSHLNLILGVYRHISDDATYDALHELVSRHLQQRSLADGDYHARSYPLPEGSAKGAKTHKWPADQSVLLASLYLYDKTRKQRLSERPIQGWLKLMESSYTDKQGLHLAALDEQLSYAKLARGSALMRSVLYMNQFAPKQARALYEAAQKHYAQEWIGLGLGGEREWPPGVDRGRDERSGLLIFGVGGAATLYGLGGARLYRDLSAYARIMRTLTTFGLPVVLSSRRFYVTSPMLAEATLLDVTSARRWFGDWPKEPLSDDAGHPGGCAIFLLFAAALALYEVISVRERIWLIRNH